MLIYAARNSMSFSRAHAFKIVWSGQCLSLVATSAAQYAFGLHIFEQTHSATSYGYLVFFNTLPIFFLSPIAGALIDRWDRRVIMLISNLGTMLWLATLAFLSFNGHPISITLLYWTVGISACFSAFLWPAYWALTAELVSPERQGHASGMIQASSAVSFILAAVLGTLLLPLWHLRGIILFNAGGFALAALALILIRNHRSRVIAAPTPRKHTLSTLFSEFSEGLRYILQRPDLLVLLGLFSIANFTLSTLSVLITPFVLSFASPPNLASVWVAGGLGMLLGSIVMSATGGPRRKFRSLLFLMLLQSVFLMTSGLWPGLLLIQLVAFSFFVIFPVVIACNQAIWQKTVAAGIQGRIFALREMFGSVCTPIAALTMGPLAERFFQPLLGPSRGLGAVLVLLAGFTTLVAAGVLLFGRKLHGAAEV
jgi:DHA3 family macrolide efflux protein-like MFS transporter